MPRGAKTGKDYARQQQAQARRAKKYSSGSVLTQAQLDKRAKRVNRR